MFPGQDKYLTDFFSPPPPHHTSGGVMIYFDRIEVVNMLVPTAGTKVFLVFFLSFSIAKASYLVAINNPSKI